MIIDAPYRYDPNHPMNPPVPGVRRQIPVDLGTGAIEFVDEDRLVRSEGKQESAYEIVAWVEYHLPDVMGGALVHRSAHVHLKKAPVFGAAIAAAIG